jgi:hypothetical protein
VLLLYCAKLRRTVVDYSRELARYFLRHADCAACHVSYWYVYEQLVSALVLKVEPKSLSPSPADTRVCVGLCPRSRLIA